LISCLISSKTVCWVASGWSNAQCVIFLLKMKKDVTHRERGITSVEQHYGFN
jgi:hypothetical protein